MAASRSAATTPATTATVRMAWTRRARRSDRTHRSVAYGTVIRPLAGSAGLAGWAGTPAPRPLPERPVVGDHPVVQVDHPVGVAGHPCVVGDQQDRLALGVRAAEQPQHG